MARTCVSAVTGKQAGLYGLRMGQGTTRGREAVGEAGGPCRGQGGPGGVLEPGSSCGHGTGRHCSGLPQDTDVCALSIFISSLFCG